MKRFKWRRGGWRALLASLLAALGAGLAPAATAQVYKWVDANGVTHYGERPQTNTKTKAKQLELREASPQPTGTEKPAAPAGLQEREIEFRKRQAMRAEEETRAAKMNAQRESTCRRARAQLIAMNAAGAHYRLNDKGERVYMSDAERDAGVAKREAEFKANCE